MHCFSSSCKNLATTTSTTTEIGSPVPLSLSELSLSLPLWFHKYPIQEEWYFEVSTNLIINCYLALCFSLSLSLIIIVSSLMRSYYSTAINIPSLSSYFWSWETFFPLGPRGGVVVFGHRGGGESRKEEASSSHIDYQFVHLWWCVQLGWVHTLCYWQSNHLMIPCK